jgi:hypothetical protein
MAPRLVPLTDAEGAKIVLDREGNRVRTKDGKKWRESGSEGDGYTLQVRKETPDEFFERLRADIASRPTFYYAREEIPRLSADLEDCREELWQQQQDIREAQKSAAGIATPRSARRWPLPVPRHLPRRLYRRHAARPLRAGRRHSPELKAGV